MNSWHAARARRRRRVSVRRRRVVQLSARLTQNCAFEWEPLTSDADFEYYFHRRDRCELLLRANGRCGGGAREPSCRDASPPSPSRRSTGSRAGGGATAGAAGGPRIRVRPRARLGAWAAAELATVAGLRVDRNRSTPRRRPAGAAARFVVDGDSTHRHVSEAHRKRIADLAAAPRRARGGRVARAPARATARRSTRARAAARAAWFARRVESWENAGALGEPAAVARFVGKRVERGRRLLPQREITHNVPARLARLERGADGAVAVAYSPLAREHVRAHAPRVAALEAAGRDHGRARLPILFVDTAVQHFDTDGGEYDGARRGEPRRRARRRRRRGGACRLLRGRPTAPAAERRAAAAVAAAAPSTMHVVPWHIATAGLDGLHPGRGDCTHFCYSPQLTEAHARLVLRAAPDDRRGRQRAPSAPHGRLRLEAARAPRPPATAASMSPR